MKQNIIRLLLVICLSASGISAPAQGRYSQFDDNSFCDAFLYLVIYRGIPDSIYFIKKDTSSRNWFKQDNVYSRIPFPQAVLGGYVYKWFGFTYNKEYFVIRYPCADSTEGSHMLSKVRDLIARSVNSAGINIWYKGTDFYLSDTNVVTMDEFSLRLAPPGSRPPGENVPSKTWEVIVSIELAVNLYFRLGYGEIEAKKDPSLVSLLNLALGPDFQMKSLKTGSPSRTDKPRERVFASTKTIPGFKARIVEIKDTTKGPPLRVFSSNRLELTADNKTADSTFLRNANELLAGLRGSLPPDYCYQMDADQPTVYFRKMPWLPQENEAGYENQVLKMRYFRMANKQLRVEIIVYRAGWLK